MPPIEIVEEDNNDGPEEPVQGDEYEGDDPFVQVNEPEKGEEEQSETGELAEPSYMNEMPPDASGHLTPPEEDDNDAAALEWGDTLDGGGSGGDDDGNGLDDTRVDGEIPWQSGPEPSHGMLDQELQDEMLALGDAVSPVIKCGVCNLPCRVGIAQETQRPYLMCQADCKFPFLSMKEQINLHVMAMNTLENKYKPHMGGTLPRCPGHQEIATLLSPKKASPQCHKIVRRLYFVCNKPQKEGGHCMVQGRRWNIPADIKNVKPNTPNYNKEKATMAGLFALNEHIKVSQDEQAARTAGAMYTNAMKDYKYQTGDFKPKTAPTTNVGRGYAGGNKRR